MFQASVTLNVLLFSPSFLRFTYICTVAIKNITNMHTVFTNQIADIVHFDNTDI